jgi:hypothetical protein
VLVWPKIALPKGLCRGTLYHDAKSNSSIKQFVHFDECSAVNNNMVLISTLTFACSSVSVTPDVSIVDFGVWFLDHIGRLNTSHRLPVPPKAGFIQQSCQGSEDILFTITSRQTNLCSARKLNAATEQTESKRLMATNLLAESCKPTGVNSPVLPGAAHNISPVVKTYITTDFKLFFSSPCLIFLFICVANMTEREVLKSAAASVYCYVISKT